MGIRNTPLAFAPPRSASQVAALRLAASKMTGPTQRAFQAERTLQDCQGKPLQAATVFGWGRHTVALGLSERRTGRMWLGAPSAFRGRKRWEAQPPEGAAVRRQGAAAPAQQAPPFRTPLADTRLTAKAALAVLGAQGYRAEQWPAPSPMAAVLKRLGLRLRTVVKAKPQKKIAETEASGANIEKKPREQRPRPASPVGGALVKRPVLWVKSPAGRSPGVCSRLGLAGTVHAGGMVDADSAQLHSTFGSSAKPSDCLVDALEAWGAALETAKQVAMTRLQSKRDNGPARRRGIRTQVRHRMVQFADQIGQPIHRLYAPP